MTLALILIIVFIVYGFITKSNKVSRAAEAEKLMNNQDCKMQYQIGCDVLEQFISDYAHAGGDIGKKICDYETRNLCPTIHWDCTNGEVLDYLESIGKEEGFDKYILSKYCGSHDHFLKLLEHRGKKYMSYYPTLVEVGNRAGGKTYYEYLRDAYKERFDVNSIHYMYDFSKNIPDATRLLDFDALVKVANKYNLPIDSGHVKSLNELIFVYSGIEMEKKKLVSCNPFSVPFKKNPTKRDFETAEKYKRQCGQAEPWWHKS